MIARAKHVQKILFFLLKTLIFGKPECRLCSLHITQKNTLLPSTEKLYTDIPD